ncbi:helix-turn-helix transcriptional regulator [Kutzneria viridogrisea]|uniref:HTH cro/C1-type domain-containing protein n=2 Tax=Kutzneria TaxID=43356 RepID=W5WHU7_9PSEU|nr:helix-turn-helix transcriptional regulator [Kutzneria albida]AHI00443.1 hypothetical protein KALB_7085 [Kutzneria albida DSM 43870]MBA8925622.1 transcriptional regulator with XRE-family HTH domain [Kutzneria viridogrisea]
MTKDVSPVVLQRRLRTELRRSRQQAGQTLKEVAEALDWSLSKVIRIETGAVGISTTDLKALLGQLGVTDAERVRELVGAAKASQRQEWWSAYRGVLDQQFLTYLGYEDAASRIRVCQGLQLPGLLQTEDYARAVIRLYTSDPELVELGVQVRMRRQQLWERATPPETVFALDEAVLRRWVGGPEVTRAQLYRLLELDARDNVSLRVLPFSLGAHPGLRGSFTIMEFPDEEQDFAVLLEQPGGDVLIRENPEETSTYVETFAELEALAHPPGSGLTEVIERVLAELPSTG